MRVGGDSGDELQLVLRWWPGRSDDGWFGWQADAGQVDANGMRGGGTPWPHIDDAIALFSDFLERI